MIRLEFNGKPFDPNDFQDALTAAALEQIVEQIREKVGSIRDPETGEFPTITVHATSLSDIQLNIEGSPALIAQVRAELDLQEDDGSSDNEGSPTDSLLRSPIPPKVFLSYATEDRALASKIAHVLNANGIDTWWAEWEIAAGDSLRQKIDEGLRNCTHFLVLLTPTSLTKSWVNQEMDAGLVRTLSEKTRFLPIRHGLPARDLPPLLAGLHSPEITDFDADMRQLIHDIHGISRKPPRGPAPALVAEHQPKSGVSPAAMAIARLFVETTDKALHLDPQYSFEEVASRTDLSIDDTTDALYELRAVMRVIEFSGGSIVTAEPELYARFDSFWKPWDPAQDGRRLVADLFNDQEFPSNPEAIGDRYEWEPRRLNPALAYLSARDLVELDTAMDGGTHLAFRVRTNDNTRRFLKSRDAV